MKRLKIVLASLLFGFLLLEGVMQLIAWHNWSGTQAAQRAESRTGEKTVLCVGDSFTWGMGADTRAGSYPSVLRAKLEETSPGGFAVLNRGYPGFDSHTILRRLPRQLRDLRPDYVYLLIGYNDRFTSEPEVLAEELDADAPVEAFPWRWRTLDLLRRIAIGTAGRRSYPAEVLGDWHSGTTTVSFREGGQMAVNNVPCIWFVSGQELRVTETPNACSLRWRREGDRLILEGDLFAGGRIELQPGPAQRDLLSRARVAIRQNRLQAAQQLLDECEPGPAVLGAQAEISKRLGNEEAFAAQLQRLRAWAADDTRARGVLARILILTGRSAEGVRLARTHLAEQPHDAALWEALADLTKRDETRLATVVEIMDTSLDALSDPGLRGVVLSNRALLRQRMGGDPVVVLAEALEAAFLLDRFTAVVTLVRSNQRTFDDQVVAKAKARLHLTPEQDATVDRVIRDVRAGAASIVGRLERHLRLCASLCSQHHAELVLLLYPEPIGLEHVVRRVGQAGLATVIDPQPRFAAALKKKKWSDLFVADGHCNDAGYAILADLVFQDLQKRTRR